MSHKIEALTFTDLYGVKQNKTRKKRPQQILKDLDIHVVINQQEHYHNATKLLPANV